MNCSNCKSADQTGEYCSFCGAKMADQNLSGQQKVQEVQSSPKASLTSIEDAAALFGTVTQTSNAPAPQPATVMNNAAASDSVPSDDGVEIALEVFGEMVEKLDQRPGTDEKPVSETTPTSQAQEPHAPVPQSAAPSSTSISAIAALVSVFFIPLLGLILGYLAKKEIAQSAGTKSGSGLVKASIVLGWIFVGFGALVTLLVVAAVLSQQ